MMGRYGLNMDERKHILHYEVASAGKRPKSQTVVKIQFN